jgi:hypothetical protein
MTKPSIDSTGSTSSPSGSSGPPVDCDHHHTGLPVSDVLAAADFYTKKLGFEQAFTWGEPPTFAGVNLDRVQIFLEQGTPNPKKKFSFTPASLSATALPARIPKELSGIFKSSKRSTASTTIVTEVTVSSRSKKKIIFHRRPPNCSESHRIFFLSSFGEFRWLRWISVEEVF